MLPNEGSMYLRTINPNIDTYIPQESCFVLRLEELDTL